MAKRRIESHKEVGRKYAHNLSARILAVLWLIAAAISLGTLSGCSGVVNANSTNGGGGGTSPSSFSVSPSSLSFGSVAMGSKISQNATVTNTGNANVTISQVSLSNNEFTTSNLAMPATLSAGQSASFQVWLNGNTAGAASGSMTLTSSDGVTSAPVALSGTVMAATPQIGVSPASVNFGTITVGSKGTQNVTLSNQGAADLTISLISVNAAAVGATGMTTPATIKAGQSAILALSYSPTVVASMTGNVTITSNDPHTPTFTIPVTGTATAAAVAPTITTPPASRTVTAGQTATFTVVAAGTAPLSYQWQKSGANIAGATGASYTTPATTTADSGSTFRVVVSNSAGTVTSAAATLTVTAATVAPTITTPPASRTVTAGQTATFTVVAAGTAPLSYQWQKSGANIAGATGASYTTPATTTADSGSTFRVVVSNSAGTVTSAAATLTVNAASAPAIQLSSTSLSFGSTVVGTNTSQALIVTNTGSATLSITQVAQTGSTSFALSGYSLPLSVNAGQHTTITVAFVPTAAGAVSGSISITSNAPTSPTSIVLSGTGVAATKTLSVSPTSLSFGNVNTGSSASQTITITNTGNSTVSISQVSATGTGFSAPNSPISLTPSQNTTVAVQFAPTTAGSATGSVTITSDATGSPATVTLSGTGVTAVQHSVALTWGASTSTVAGYNVYRSTVSGTSYARVNGSLVTNLNYTDSTVQSGTTYYYVTTAVDSSGNESVYSNQVSATIP
jgi:Abnormal spindle-like microcephaly-assoc'd, ASPM-SPD-2-Hydin/Cep192 domain 4/HYDIN/CFA65/VesB-like, Ig-like domain